MIEHCEIRKKRKPQEKVEEQYYSFFNSKVKTTIRYLLISVIKFISLSIDGH